MSQEGVDDRDLSASFVVGATPRRSTSSLDDMSAPASISSALVQIYMDFDGNVDMYQRRGMPKRELYGDGCAWHAIDGLRTRLYIVAAGLASAKFSASAEADLLAWAPDEEARRMVLAMVDRDLQSKR